jgi:hypothetical protein
MEELLPAWNGKFGPEVKPPEWVFNFSIQDVCEQDVEKQISETEARVGKLREEVDQALFLLAWLKKVRENGSIAPRSVALAHKPTSKDNHVLGASKEDKEPLNDPTEDPRESGVPELVLVGTPDKACLKGSNLFSPTTNSSEDSPSSSDYHTAGHNSSSEEVSISVTNLGEEVPCATSPARDRVIRKVSSKDYLVVKEVNKRLTEEGGLYKSCEFLGDSDKSPQRERKHRRSSSAPLCILESVKSEESSTSGLALESHPNASAGSESGPAEQSPLTNAAVRVVLRQKIGRRPSLPIFEIDMNEWRGTGGVSSETANRSSNGVLDMCDRYNFMVNEDEDSDPALINIMARHRTPRSSVSTDDSPTGKQASSWRASDLVSPVEDPCHTPIPGVDAAGVSAKHVAPLRKRSGTHDASPIKRDRFSYHYSDDECLTPKLDSGDHSTFSNSPSNSNRCSHRNSRSSNGIIDEEAAYDYTLWKEKPDMLKIERKKTVTPEGPAESRALALSESGRDDSHLTSTLTSYVGYPGSHDVFESKADALSELKLGDLDLDVDLALSQLRNKPDMSMATLLDMNENKRMNLQLSPKDHSLSEDLEYGESIEIDEATISAFTVSNEMYGSRSNSANSIPGLFGSDEMSPPDQDSPTHSAHQGVNLRQSGAVNRSHRKRMGNLDLELMTRGQSSDNDNLSRSSASLTSEEESTSPVIVDENLVSMVFTPNCIMHRSLVASCTGLTL